MEEQHVNRLVQATKNSLDEMSVEQLKEIEKHIIKELQRRTIRVPEKDDGHYSKDRPS
jgi:secreted Zn-dependent insulinase-like peptidase